MNKQQRTQCERKKYRPLTSLVKALLLLSLVFGINSCKKDVLVPTSIRAKEKNDNKIQNISYSQFLSKVELNSTGSLKQVLQSAVNNSKSTKVNSVSSTPIYDIETTNVKELIVNDTISHVLALKSQTPHATHFQNITVQTAKGKTIAFLTTYIPTKEWIKEWKAGKHIDTVFRGEIYVNRINLSDVVTTSSKTNGTSINAIVQSNSINIGGNTIKLRPGECETYSVYETVSMPCGYAPNPHYSNADCTFWSSYPDPYNLPAGCRDYPPYTAVIYVGESMYCEPDVPPTPGTGGGGNTTPNPPGDYDPCDEDPPAQNSIKKRGGFNLQVIPPPPCDEDPNNPYPTNPPPFDENSPINLPNTITIDDYPSDWEGNEDEFALTSSLIFQQGIDKFDPVPERYYITSTPVNMTGAPASHGLTVKGAPRNYNYFWKQLATARPEMFSPANRNALKGNPAKAPIVDDQWIKFNPTHAPYKGGKLIHHHDQQGFLAYALPEKVHQKWTARLHSLRTGGKISGIGGKLLTLGSALQSVFTQFTGFLTGDPDAWINWFGGSKNEKGKIYYHPGKDVYFEIIDQQDFRDANGRLIRAIVTYDVFSDNVYDSDEGKFMGVGKLARFTEDCDIINGTSKDATLTKM